MNNCKNPFSIMYCWGSWYLVENKEIYEEDDCVLLIAYKMLQ